MTLFKKKEAKPKVNVPKTFFDFAATHYMSTARQHVVLLNMAKRSNAASK